MSARHFSSLATLAQRAILKPEVADAVAAGEEGPREGASGQKYKQGSHG